MATTAKRPPKGPAKGKPAARVAAKPAAPRGKQFTVDFLAYSGDGKTLGIGVRIKRAGISLDTADSLFSCKRLEIRMFLGEDAPGQKLFWEDAKVRIETTADVRRWSVTAEQIGIRLMMVVDNKLDGHVLEQFSKKRGVLEVITAAEPDNPNASVPASELDDDDLEEDEELDEEEDEEEDDEEWEEGDDDEDDE